MDLFAWIGEGDGDGQIEIKIAIVPAGPIPLCAMALDRHRLEALSAELQAQADAFGKTIRLARFVFVEDVLILLPNARPAAD